MDDSRVQFSVQNCYKVIMQQIPRRATTTGGIPLKVIWDNKVLARINVFMWEVDKQALQTKKRLKKVFPEIDLVCALCGQEEETLSHLLLECEFSKRIWVHLAEGFGVQLPGHSSVNDKLSFWAHYSWDDEVKDWFWVKAPAVVMWTVWIQRNDKIFRQVKTDWQESFFAVILRVRLGT